MTIVLPLILALLSAPAALAAGRLRPRWAVPVGAGAAALAFAAALRGWAAGGGAVRLPWAPAWGLELAFELDALATLYILLATWIGLAVLLYSSAYLPHHLRRAGREARDQLRFYGFLLLFMGAMVGLVLSADLVLLFLFWDLTAVASYFLIGYDREREDARSAALTALGVTGGTSVLFLVGVVLLQVGCGTTRIPELGGCAATGVVGGWAAGFILVAALAKSAQVPFHFWLPRAMAAPTPVSAYLHSAAMVAAGVFVIQRLDPVLAAVGWIDDVLLAAGGLSMLVGGVLALGADRLKSVLAYSTIAQYGYVVVLLGIGGPYGRAGAAYYVFAHALAKSALFLTAGAVTHATDETRLSRIGGVARRLPVLAAASALAAAALSGLPLTAGYFKDELFFAAAFGRGPVLATAAVASAALTFAYIWRFWGGIFLGPAGDAARVPVRLMLPVALLALVALASGIVVDPAVELAARAAGDAVDAVHVGYEVSARPELFMALAAWAAGFAVLRSTPRWSGVLDAVSGLGRRFGPDRGWTLTFDGLARASDALHRRETRDLRTSIEAILIPTGVLIGVGLVLAPAGLTYQVGGIGAGDLPLAATLLLIAATSVAMLWQRYPFSLVLTQAVAGFGLAVAFALYGAPDVALVAVLVGTIATLLLIVFLRLFPARTEWFRLSSRDRARSWRVGIVVFAFVFIMAWTTLSRPAAPGLAAVQFRLAEAAHAHDVVTVILADFRGLDTLGEATVLAVALLAVAALLARRRA